MARQLALILWLGAVGCTTTPPGADPSTAGPGNGGDGASDPADPSDESPVPEPRILGLSGPPAFDPARSTEVLWSLSSDRDGVVQGALTDADGTVVAAWDDLSVAAGPPSDLPWDGRDDAGAAVPLGSYALTVTGPDGGEARAALVVLRTGITLAHAEQAPGAGAERVPLYYHRRTTLQDPAVPFSGLLTLDDEDGHPQDLPPVAAPHGMWTPADGAQPVAYTAGSRPILSLDLPSVALGAWSPEAEAALSEAELSVSVDGWTVLSGTPLQAGEPLRLQRDAPLDDTLGLTDTTLELVFEAIDADGTAWPLGTPQQVPVRFLRVLGPPTFGLPGDRYHPWVEAIEPMLAAIEGTPAVVDAVRDAVVDHVFLDLGLVYDDTFGASAYSEYGSFFSYDDPNFFMTAFLNRAFGDVINCSDAAAIVGAHANMVGAELRSIILLSDFDLNYIQAIGHPGFTECPFGSPWGCSFSYHAVTTANGGGTIWDGTLALDGDNQPGAAPHTQLLVQSIPGNEYLYRLVGQGTATYHHESMGTIQ